MELSKEHASIRNMSQIRMHVKNLREMISEDDLEPPSEFVINTGVFQTLLKLTTHNYRKDKELVSETTWVLLNIIGGASN